MQYAMLIYSDESQEPQPGTKEFDDYIGEYFALSDHVKNNGMYQAGAALQSVSTATTVKVRDGKVATTDGPFAATKEQLGGSTSSSARISTKPSSTRRRSRRRATARSRCARSLTSRKIDARH